MYLAIDIGATKTLIALFSEHGHCLKRSKFLTNKDPKFFLSELSLNLKDFENRSINSVVVAVPAIVQKNYTFSPNNLPSWKNFSILPTIKKLFNCKIFILNDADLATLYETGPYSGRAIYLTFSTGIGGGVAENGVVTKSSATFEPGHKKYTFDDGKRIEWEDIASANAIGKLFGKQASKITKKSALDTIAYRLSIGLTDIINDFHPKTIIIGGPLGLIFKDFHPFLKTYLKSSVIDPYDFPRLVRAKRPTESVIYGCYLYGKYH